MTRAELAMQFAKDIVVAYLGTATVEPDVLVTLVHDVKRALAADDSYLASPAERTVEAPAPELIARTADQAAAEAPAMSTPAVPGEPERASGPRAVQLTPAVPVSESIRPDCVISLEDGKPYRSLRRHLMARYGMTPDEYRTKWGLPSDYPMVAPDYSSARSEVAKRIGLGRQGASNPRRRKSDR